ncbi:MAG TPA: hypothetical protein VNH18_19170 [Bryobacteraceae bacterium]|nr:hypothetical protein [Bryobacteraceae bacterium]
MANEETGRQRRRHRSRSEADQLAAEYEASGLRQEAYARQRDIPLKTLARYVTRYRKQKAGIEAPRWVAAEVAGRRATEGELAVVLAGGRRIEVNRGFDALTLRQLVAVLEQV